MRSRRNLRVAATPTAVKTETLPVVPNQPKTPVKCFRIPAELYDAAMARARSRGEALTDVVRDALERYIAEGQTAPTV